MLLEIKATLSFYLKILNPVPAVDGSILLMNEGRKSVFELSQKALMIRLIVMITFLSF